MSINRLSVGRLCGPLIFNDLGTSDSVRPSPSRRYQNIMETVASLQPVCSSFENRETAHNISSDDLIMYTITADATLRIFMPVLDAPDVLQLHTSLDLFSSLPFFVAEQFEPLGSSVFWVDGSTVGSVIANILKAADPQDDVRSKRIREIRDESWDLFLRILGDGSIVVTAIAVCFTFNIALFYLTYHRISTKSRLHYSNNSLSNNLNLDFSQNRRSIFISYLILIQA